MQTLINDVARKKPQKVLDTSFKVQKRQNNYMEIP